MVQLLLLLLLRQLLRNNVYKTALANVGNTNHDCLLHLLLHGKSALKHQLLDFRAGWTEQLRPVLLAVPQVFEENLVFRDIDFLHRIIPHSFPFFHRKVLDMGVDDDGLELLLPSPHAKEWVGASLRQPHIPNLDHHFDKVHVTNLPHRLLHRCIPPFHVPLAPKFIPEVDPVQLIINFLQYKSFLVDHLFDRFNSFYLASPLLVGYICGPRNHPALFIIHLIFPFTLRKYAPPTPHSIHPNPTPPRRPHKPLQNLLINSRAPGNPFIRLANPQANTCKAQAIHLSLLPLVKLSHCLKLEPLTPCQKPSLKKPLQ
mmetsp:Transcript_38094/g.151183  ORF Transcript_38094/g.151183 Transcript_38094/m.151183 type:complete len:315 (-) Transcript_38094:232-1176(-)